MDPISSVFSVFEVAMKIYDVITTMIKEAKELEELLGQLKTRLATFNGYVIQLAQILGDNVKDDVKTLHFHFWFPKKLKIEQLEFNEDDVPNVIIAWKIEIDNIFNQIQQYQIKFQEGKGKKS